MSNQTKPKHVAQMPIITHNEVHNFISNALISGLSPMLLGDVGAGKSSAFVRYANKHNLLFIPIYLDSMYEMDVIGYAVPNKEKGKFEYLPCDLFPVQGDKMPINPKTNKEYAGYLILFEEFGNCPASMQVAAQRVLLERSIGSHKLAKNAYLCVAGNRVSSNANARPISAAVRTRCSIAGFDSTTSESITETIDYMAKAKYHPAVISFLKANKVVMANPDKQSQEDGESPFLVPRTLEAVSNLLKAKSKVKDLSAWYYDNIFSFAALIGRDNADLLANYVVSNASTAASGAFAEILNSPESAQLPTDILDTLKVSDYIVKSVSTANEALNACTYVQRLAPELAESLRNSFRSSSNQVLKKALDAAPIDRDIIFGG